MPKRAQQMIPGSQTTVTPRRTRRYLVSWCWSLIAILTLAVPICAHAPRHRPRQVPPPSRNCGGVVPYPCARTDQAFQNYKPDPLNLGSVGHVGVPFINDFGETMMRVTDAMTDTPYQSSLANEMFKSDDSAERNVWSKYDHSLFSGDGGYRFSATSSQGVALVFALDDKTLKLERLDGSPGSFPHGFTNGFTGQGSLKLCDAGTGQSACTWSYLSPTTVFAVNNTTQISKYDFDEDGSGIQPIYDAAGCPGIPRLTGPYSPVLTQSNDDSKFAFFNGGNSQGSPALAVYYDAGTGDCFWYDTRTGTTGGSGMSATHVDGGVGLLSPPAAPVVVPKLTGGHLVGPATYCVELTLRTLMNPTLGETTAGGETCARLLATRTGSLQIVFPSYSNPQALLSPPGSNKCVANASGCRPFNLYIGVGSRNETLQATGIGQGAASYTQTGALTSGSRPPTTNTAGYNIHNAQISRDGRSLRLDYHQGYTLFWWEPGTRTVLACTAGTCQGHMANGFTRWVNQGRSGSGLGLTIQGTDFLDLSVLIHGAPAGYTPQDVHLSWNNDQTSDAVPFLSAFFNSTVHQGNGSMDPNLNPVVKIRSALDQEILGISTDGSGRIWRFGHVRSGPLANPYGPPDFASQPIGQVSQDGRYFVFNSNWLWHLGTYRGSAKPCPQPGSRCRTDVFLIKLQ